jgi:hypothetical protein
MEIASAYDKKSICLSAASLMDFSKVMLFPSLFGRLGLDFLVLLGRCQKYTPCFFLSLLDLIKQSLKNWQDDKVHIDLKGPL